MKLNLRKRRRSSKYTVEKIEMLVKKLKNMVLGCSFSDVTAVSKNKVTASSCLACKWIFLSERKDYPQNYSKLGFHLVLSFGNTTNRPVDQAITRSSGAGGGGVWGSCLWPVKLDTVFPTARHRCDISSKEAVSPGRNDAKMGPPTHYTLRRITASIMKDLMVIRRW